MISACDVGDLTLGHRAELQALLWTRPVGIVTTLITAMGNYRTGTASVFARWDAKIHHQLSFSF